MTRLYLAGPMTGLPEFNYPAFHAAAKQLRGAGYAVENPAESEMPLEKPEWSDWMRLAIEKLIRCDHLAFLPGVMGSRGGRIKCNLASALSMNVLPVTVWLADPQLGAPSGALEPTGKAG